MQGTIVDCGQVRNWWNEEWAVVTKSIHHHGQPLWGIVVNEDSHVPRDTKGNKGGQNQSFDCRTLTYYPDIQPWLRRYKFVAKKKVIPDEKSAKGHFGGLAKSRGQLWCWATHYFAITLDSTPLLLFPFQYIIVPHTLGCITATSRSFSRRKRLALTDYGILKMLKWIRYTFSWTLPKRFMLGRIATHGPNKTGRPPRHWVNRLQESSRALGALLR